MSKGRKLVPKPTTVLAVPGYDQVLGHVVDLLESARRAAARSVNAVMTATYWAIGWRIVEFEQAGQDRSQYGAKLLARLSDDLTAKFGRGFSRRNLEQMRLFYRGWPIAQTLSAQFESKSSGDADQLPGSRTFPPTAGTWAADPTGEEPQATSALSAILETASEQSGMTIPELAHRFPLPWSHYVLLLKVEKPEARRFYEAEAHRNGWTVRQLERQVTTLFYERTLASRNKDAMLKKGAGLKPGEVLTPE